MGNSTDGVARLMEAWLSRVYPALEVIRVHSLSNLFRYDENIAFVNHELLPKIEAMRDELALQYAARWRELLRITISFAVRAPSIPPPHHHASRGVEARRDAIRAPPRRTAPPRASRRFIRA